jgi:SNF2 family DNA or RNA helicase
MLDDLHQLLTGSGWMLRRLQDEVAVQIPPISYHELPIEPIKLSAQEVAKEWPDYSQQMVQLQAKLDYEEELIRLALGQPNLLDKDKVAILEGLAGSIAALRRYTGLQKVDSVADLLTQELGADEYPKVVIFFVHRSVGEALQTRLSPFGAHLLYGGLTPRRRDEIIQDFQRPEAGARVILVQYQAGATAINLQVAHQVVCVEVPWIGSELAQGVKRCHRIGQKSPVHVRFATLINSYDEVIMNLLRRRAREINHILDGQPRELMQDTPADPNLLKTPAELRRMVLG